ncbi:MAG: methylmalonyl Co-A mutase-associated GTPase MeaB, partial [Haloarculaceae archaeon]
GDDVQMLKAGILEIADLFIVNKADLDGANRTVQELRELVEYQQGGVPSDVGHHGATAETVEGLGPGDSDGGDGDDDGWTPPIVETVANRGEGVEDVLEALAGHRTHLEESGEGEEQTRTRYAEEVRTLLREDLNGLLAAEIDRRGGLDAYVDDILAGETDPYSVADELLAPIADCIEGNDREGAARPEREPTAED